MRMPLCSSCLGALVQLTGLRSLSFSVRHFYGATCAQWLQSVTCFRLTEARLGKKADSNRHEQRRILC